MICPKCEKEFSNKVAKIHIPRCPGKAKVKKVQSANTKSVQKSASNKR